MTIKVDKLAGPNAGPEGRRLATFWHDQLDTIKDAPEYKRWYTRGETVEKRYRDERNRVDEEGQRHYNALWANVEILKPALYGKVPVPIAERRFRDKDPIGRGAAQILERALRNEIEICGFDEAMQQAVADYLLPGRGTVWVRYEPEIEEGVSLPPEVETDLTDEEGNIAPKGSIDTGEDDKVNEPAGEDDGEEDAQNVSREKMEAGPDNNEEDKQEAGATKLKETGDRILRESTPVDYIHWRDFYTLPARARTWAEVTAVAKRVFMSRDQMIRRFGKTIGKGVPLRKDDRDQKQNSSTTENLPDQDKGIVYEIWARDEETVYWIADQYDYLCDRKDDPLQLENFFPCPRPIFANATNTTLVPVPDFLEYQDQALQIDELTNRISMLSKACKVAGVYNAAAKDIQRLMDESIENELIPVDDWAAFANDGGVEGNISLLPLKEIMGVLNELIVVKEKCVVEMDRLTGITDIMRGTTDARETLGGQRLKTNNSGTRLTRRQNEVARFARDTLRIMADIMAQHFTPQSLVEVSGALYEEGLGEVDIVSQPQQPAQPAPAQGPQGPSAPPQGSSPNAAAPPGAQQGVSPPSPPSASPPGQPPQQQNLPATVPQQPPAPMPPPMDPYMQARIEGLKRIARAIDLIRDERLRGFRVDIEVDSTIYGDYAEERSERTQFLTATTQFLQISMALSAQVPEMTPLLGKFLQFGVRGFKVGRDLEAAIEDFCDQAPKIAAMKQQQMASQKNPEQMKAETEAFKAQAEIQKEQMSAQAEQTNAKTDLDSKNIDLQISQLKLAQMQMDMEVKKHDVEVQKQQSQLDLHKHNQEMEFANQQHQQKMHQTKMDHQVKMTQMAMQPMIDQQNMQMQQQHDQQNMHMKMQHEAGMAQQQQGHEANMAAQQGMPAAPGGPMGQPPPGAQGQPTPQQGQPQQGPQGHGQVDFMTMMQHMAQLAQAMQQTAVAMEQATGRLTAPRRIVRGPDGRPTHVEPMQ